MESIFKAFNFIKFLIAIGRLRTAKAILRFPAFEQQCLQHVSTGWLRNGLDFA